jgi:putative FmdB family regulatory protein
MPIYEYRCRECGQVAEVFVRSSAGGAQNCPSCGSTSLEKLPSAPHLGRNEPRKGGTTCCGREERCEAPPCSSGHTCHRK